MLGIVIECSRDWSSSSSIGSYMHQAPAPISNRRWCMVHVEGARLDDMLIIHQTRNKWGGRKCGRRSIETTYRE